MMSTPGPLPLPSRPFARALLSGSAVVLVAALPLRAAPQASPLSFHWIDDRGREIPALVAGDTLTVRVDGLAHAAAYDLVLHDETGAQLGFVRAATDLDGSFGPEVIWWDSGVSGVDPAGDGRGGKGLESFADATHYLMRHTLTLDVHVTDVRNPGGGQLLMSAQVPVVAHRATPMLWFSDATGNYRTSFEAGKEEIFVTGENLPAGSSVDLYVVPDRTSYAEGDELKDVTGFEGSSHRDRVHLAPRSTAFTVPVWPGAYQQSGRFDLVGRIDDPAATADTTFHETDLLFHGVETGLEVRPPSAPLGPAGVQDIEADIAGRRTLLVLSPGFRFGDVFLRHETVRGALDPTDVPADHKGGDYASIYVVPARGAAGWHKNPAIGTDLTEVVEIRQMKPGTLEMSIGTIWTDPDPANAEQMKCDVVLDFIDGTIYDGLYTPGFDIIDHLAADGLAIVDDPAQPGPYPVGRTEYDFTDAYDIPWGDYKDKNVDVRAVVAYPAEIAGTDPPVWGTNKEFPLIVILHGNHIVCKNFNCTCQPKDRVPNHKGYNYLLDLWASQGFIAVSIDGYDITGCPTDRFIERGALILEHLRYWKNWNDKTVSDPTFSGRFWNRVAMQRIGIAGHSRGGEGVAAAVQINRDLGLGYDIKAAVLISPTDYNWSKPPGGGPIEFLIEDTPVFNIMGSSDGDVWDNEGAQLYDRASPNLHFATKSQAYIYGADHNSWNTIWIDPAWNGGSDGVGSGRITAQQQQDTGRVFLTSWWMAWLQDRQEMLAFHRDEVESPLLSGVKVYWSYESKDHVAVDDFEQTPANKNLNTLGGANTTSVTPLTWNEYKLAPGNYDNSFYQDTRGVIVGWDTQTDYVAEIPDANRDVSGYGYLAVRTAQIWDNKTLNTGGSQRFLVNLEDSDGRHAAVDVDSRGFAPIPVGYNNPISGIKSMLSTIRIPLRAFRQDNSKVDLTRVTKVIFTLQDTGLLAFDDIQFTK